MEGAITALQEERPDGDVAMVCNELTSDTRLGLTQNVITTVIATPLPALCDQTLKLMHQTVVQKVRTHVGQIFLPFDIFVSENI